MSVPPMGDYSHGPVPTVFVEQAPPPPPKEEEKGVMISRGFLAVVALLLLGALVASDFFLWSNWNAAKTEVKTKQDKLDVLEPKLTALDTNLKNVTLERDQFVQKEKDRQVKYGGVETQLGLADDMIKKTADLLALDSKKGYDDPNNKDHQTKLAYRTDSRWKDAAETLLKDKVAKLQILYNDVAAWSAPAPGPNLQPGKPTFGGGGKPACTPGTAGC